MVSRRQTLDSIGKSRVSRLSGSRDQYRALSRRTRPFLRRDQERYVRTLAEDIEDHLNDNNLKPAYQALKKLRSMSTYRVCANRTADDCLLSVGNGQMPRWAEYFEQLFKVNPLSRWLKATGLQVMDADPPINEAVPSIDEVKEAVAKLRGGKSAGICNICAELLKAEGEAIIR